MTRRIIRGLAATWDLDTGGDVIVQGAFANTLADWRAQAGRRIIPLIDQHDYSSVTKVAGKMVSATETDEGLDCEFELLPEGDPLADALHARAKGGHINGLSIGYIATKVVRADTEEARELGVERFLKEIELTEVSAVIWPMNTAALITSAKHREITSVDIRRVKRRVDELLRAEQGRRFKDTEDLQLRCAQIMEKKRAGDRQQELRMRDLSYRVNEIRARAGLPPFRRRWL